MSFRVLPSPPSLGFCGSPAQGMGLESWEHAQGSPGRTSGGFILHHLQGPQLPAHHCPGKENFHFLPFLEGFCAAAPVDTQPLQPHPHEIMKFWGAILAPCIPLWPDGHRGDRKMSGPLSSVLFQQSKLLRDFANKFSIKPHP